MHPSITLSHKLHTLPAVKKYPDSHCEQTESFLQCRQPGRLLEQNLHLLVLESKKYEFSQERQADEELQI